MTMRDFAEASKPLGGIPSETSKFLGFPSPEISYIALANSVRFVWLLNPRSNGSATNQKHPSAAGPISYR